MSYDRTSAPEYAPTGVHDPAADVGATGGPTDVSSSQNGGAGTGTAGIGFRHQLGASA